MRETCWYVFTHDMQTRVKHVISAILIQICILYTARILHLYSVPDKTPISSIYNTLSTCQWLFHPLIEYACIYTYKIMIKGIIWDIDVHMHVGH